MRIVLDCIRYRMLPTAHLSREYRRGLTAPQRVLLTAGILAIHVAGGWGLLQVDAVREAAAATAPLMFSLIAPTRSEPTPPPPTPAPPRPKVTPAPLISTPTPNPVAVATEPPPSVQPVRELTQAIEPAEPSAPAAPSPEPKMIPPSAVQYLIEPPLQYPRASRKLREAGRVIVRVLVDEAGMPREVQVRTSSGFPRLDDAAISAVEKARFKPYTENGRPTAGWALVPLDFSLET